MNERKGQETIETRRLMRDTCRAMQLSRLDRETEDRASQLHPSVQTPSVPIRVHNEFRLERGCPFLVNFRRFYASPFPGVSTSHRIDRVSAGTPASIHRSFTLAANRIVIPISRTSNLSLLAACQAVFKVSRILRAVGVKPIRRLPNNLRNSIILSR